MARQSCAHLQFMFAAPVSYSSFSHYNATLQPSASFFTENFKYVAVKKWNKQNMPISAIHYPLFSSTFTPLDKNFVSSLSLLCSNFGYFIV